jgi:hypothetical protein
LLISKYKEYVELFGFGYDSIEFMFMKTPCFAKQPGNAVTVYGKPEFLFGD